MKKMLIIVFLVAMGTLVVSEQLLAGGPTPPPSPQPQPAPSTSTNSISPK